MNTTSQLQSARSFLVFHHPFIAVPLLRLPLVADESEETASTDGAQIRYNPVFMASLSAEETVFLLAHEVLHVMLAHHLRRATRNLKAWNAAGDYVINGLLHEAQFALVRGALFDPRFTGWSTEQVYDHLWAEAESQLAASRLTGPSAGDPSSLADSSPALEDFLPEGAGGRVEDLTGGSGRPLTAPEQRHHEAELAVSVFQARRAESMVRGRSSLSAAFARPAESLSPGFDARGALIDFVTSCLERDDYSWSRPNRRYLPLGFYLPGCCQSERLEDLLVVIDTSASIRPKHLSLLAGACDDILSAFPHTLLRAVYCDSQVRSTEDFTAVDSPLSFHHAEGGGGTRFAAAFDWVRLQGFVPRVVVYLTDLDGGSPADPGYPVVWLSVSATAPDPSFGRRINLIGR
jgi:predicted metal-dependent peptidase